MSKRLTFIIDKPLHGDIRTQEFLDAILMAAVFDQQVTVVFLGDGVYAIKQHQKPYALDMKNSLPVFDTLPVYDINDVVVEQESLGERGLTVEQLQIPLTVLSREKLSQQMAMADHIFSF
ncbi:MAG: sulfurtransferase complex subunit TusC [Piscirickettsiaceae bacterium]|nr:MAG: sulfurtransferase complex subunit TusC [Piscirickettsiaceae bacterium]PCI70862.1 MAG: sulfurtransferase complex subunit TusC [Piscirickettsiaceae bacterium]